MTKEIKLAFDKSLSKMLDGIALGNERIKATKKRLKILSKLNSRNFAELEFDYLGDQKAYYLSITGWSADVAEYIKQVQPPYPSNVPAGFDHHFFMSTLMERRGVFSRVDGKIHLSDIRSVDEVMMHIERCIKDNYIPKIENFLEASPALIENVVENPDFYSYPIPLISMALKRNSMNFEELKLSLGRMLVKNPAFDKALLASSSSPSLPN